MGRFKRGTTKYQRERRLKLLLKSNLKVDNFGMILK